MAVAVVVAVLVVVISAYVVVRSCCCRGRLSGPFAPSIKSLPSGKEILLFERGEPRASYKISRLEVIFMGPWAGRFLVLFCAQKSTATSFPV